MYLGQYYNITYNDNFSRSEGIDGCVCIITPITSTIFHAWIKNNQIVFPSDLVFLGIVWSFHDRNRLQLMVRQKPTPPMLYELIVQIYRTIQLNISLVHSKIIKKILGFVDNVEICTKKITLKSKSRKITEIYGRSQPPSCGETQRSVYKMKIQ